MNVGQEYVNGAVSESAVSRCPNILFAIQPNAVTSVISLPSSQALSCLCLIGSRGTLESRHLPLARSALSLQLLVSSSECVSCPQTCLDFQLNVGNASSWIPPFCVFGLWSYCWLLVTMSSLCSRVPPTSIWTSGWFALWNAQRALCPLGFRLLVCWGLWVFCVSNLLWLWPHSLASALLVLLSFILCVLLPVRSKIIIIILILFLFLINWVLFVLQWPSEMRNMICFVIFFLSDKGQIVLLNLQTLDWNPSLSCFSLSSWHTVSDLMRQHITAQNCHFSVVFTPPVNTEKVAKCNILQIYMRLNI